MRYKEFVVYFQVPIKCLYVFRNTSLRTSSLDGTLYLLQNVMRSTLRACVRARVVSFSQTHQNDHEMSRGVFTH